MADAKATAQAIGTGAVIAGQTAAFGTGLGLAAASRSRKDEAVISMMGLNIRDEIELPEQRLQWWPASLTDSIAIGWQEKTLPGASHGVMQWTANGGRTIAFQVKLSREVEYPFELRQAAPTIPAADYQQTHDNVNIAAMIRYLRSYCYPEYNEGLAEPPVVAVVNLPGTEISEEGNDYFFGVMTSCDVNYLKAFPSGRPRLVEVNLSFKQVVQSPRGVFWKGRRQLRQLNAFDGASLSLPPFQKQLRDVRDP